MHSQLSLALLLGFSASLAAQTIASPGEERASAAFEAARRAGPLALHGFLEAMPKGADLHMHLSGAIYAETFLMDAAEDGVCVDPVAKAFSKKAPCVDGLVPASNAFEDQALYDALVDSFSMRSFVPSTGTTGHDQFFVTFGRFGGLAKDHHGEWLDEVATRAAAQNEQYLEVMDTPSFGGAAALGYKLGWPVATHPASDGDTSAVAEANGASRAQLAVLRDKLLAGGLRDEIAVDRAAFAKALAERSRIERCGQADAAAACSVQIKFLYQILRAFPPQQVFAQTLLGFEVASIDPDVVGINFVQPEDAYLAMSEYHRQMMMLDYLHSVYPKVHISLHAGELAPGLVPPAGLRFHIREAVEVGHAERIGHGVDAMYENEPQMLLKEMAEKHVMVEINLTSNDGILGVTTPNHPLPNYLAAKVPVALSTDDEGVSRIDLTHEYVRAALEYKLGYRALKQMARTGMEHTFLAGESLWAAPDAFGRVKATCAGQTVGGLSPAAGCGAFLRDNPHAAAQWELERRFRVFETGR
jgi:adenosine deaminase